LETTKVSNLPAVPREQSRYGRRYAIPLTNIPEENTKEFFQTLLLLQLCLFSVPESQQQSKLI